MIDLIEMPSLAAQVPALPLRSDMPSLPPL
jgi:hypothetical protein